MSRVTSQECTPVDLSTRSSGVTAARDWVAPGVIVLVSWLLVVLIFWQTVEPMAAVWSQSRTFAHGFLVLPATAYLVWSYRQRLNGLMPIPSPWGFLLLAVFSAVWLFGHFNDALMVQQLAVVAMLPGLVWTTLGSAVTRALLFPLGFLFFAIPVGTSLEPWLQDFTAAFVVAGLQFAGIPVYWEGNFLVVPSRTWEVARDCAGLRYVLPGMALGYMYTAVVYQRWSRRVGFLLACLMLLIVANGLRAYGIILGDHLGITEGADHRVFSYSIYGMTMLPLLWLGFRWREPADQCGGSASSGPHPSPVMVHQADHASSSLGVAVGAVGGTAVLALAPLCAWLYQIIRSSPCFPS